MFEKFTDAAGQSLRWAHQEADALGSAATGTEHLVLGLLRLPDTHPVRVALTRYGVTKERALDIVVHMDKPPRANTLSRLSTDLSNVLRSAHQKAGSRYRQPERHNDWSVEPGHLLRAILAKPDCGGARLLAELGVDGTRVTNELVQTNPAVASA